ncbi:MAG: hypothetical protein H7A51_01040 [Akkermansiaceae bacterium]|nr:hypothetical protein [Akkermansiaceae bacterium]
MKHTIKSLMIGGSMLAAAPAYAELETEIHAGYHTIYEFRGVDFGDDLYEGGLDLSYELAEGLSLSGGAWYADTNGGGFDELDLYIGLTKTLGAVDVSVGYTYYMFPGASGANTDELYIGVSTEFENGIGLSLTYYEDIDVIDGGYLEFEASKSFELSACVNLDLAAGAAWSFDYNADVDGSALDGFNHFYVSVGAPWEIRENMTLTPYIKYVGASSDLDNDFDATASDDLFYGGITLSYSF